MIARYLCRVGTFIACMFLFCNLAIAQAGCSGAPITFSPGTQNQTFTAAANSGVLGVIMQSDCNWHPTTNTSFLHLGTFAGLGSGNAFFTIDANPNLATRSGTITIFGNTSNTSATATITQSAAAGDFSLIASPPSQAVVAGGTATFTILISRTGGFAGAVTFGALGLPSGTSATFNPASTTGGSSTMTVTTNAGATLGNFGLTITGQNGTVIRSAAVTLNIQDFSLSVSPSSQTALLPSGSASYAVTINRLNGFAGTVNLGASGLPGGTSIAFNPSSTTGTSSTGTLTVNITAVTGSFPFTISGVGGGMTHTAQPSVTIAAAAPPPSVIPFNTAQLVLSTSYTDAGGWYQPQYGSTIMFGDINGDGKTDACGRGQGGIYCGLATGTGFTTPTIVTTDYSDVQGWDQSQYYDSLRMADVTGDGRIDICGRGGAGIICSFGNGNGTFGAAQLVLSTGYTDAGGWNQPQYGSTIMFADINGDGKADACGRGQGGVYCGLATGTGFATPTIVSTDFTDAGGWNQSQYYDSMRMADVTGDGHVDICGRGQSGIYCAFGNGNGTFGAAHLVTTDFSDAVGWNLPQYGSTIMFADIDGDGKADVCARGAAGVFCALSTGTGFGPTFLASPDFTDAQGWNQSIYYDSLLRLSGVVGNGRIDICGRSSGGIVCSLR